MSIKFQGGDQVNEIVPAGSGTFDTLGMFGAGGFGFSVAVNAYQDTSFSSNDDGTAQSGQVPNVTFVSAASGFVTATAANTALSGVQLGDSTLNIQFTNGTAVKTQNAAFRAFDGSNINNNPSGVTVQAFELIGAPSGSGQSTSNFNTLGDSTWSQIAGTGALSLGDQLWNGTTHDYWLGVSAKPTSIGAKTFGYFFELEFF